MTGYLRIRSVPLGVYRRELPALLDVDVQTAGDEGQVEPALQHLLGLIKSPLLHYNMSDLTGRFLSEKLRLITSVRHP